VVWLFTRNEQRVRFAVTRGGSAGGYVLLITTEDGPVQIEDIALPATLMERVAEEAQRLRADGWRLA